MTFRKWSLLFICLLTANTGHGAPDKAHWSAYKSNMIHIEISVPSDWSPVKAPNALVFRYDDLTGGTAGIGILKSDQKDTTIEQTADQAFEHAGRPTDWVRSNSRVAGMRAIKIVGADPKNADHKIVHYYVETSQGIYLIQCQGTQDRWATYSPIFSTILSKLKFLP